MNFNHIKIRNNLIFLIILLVLGQSAGQYFAPEKLIVNATELRFRDGPNLTSTIIATLADGEVLEFLDFVNHSEPSYIYYERLNDIWLKVKRERTGNIGYVYGTYVRPANTGFKYGQDCHRVPLLNWYGIHLKNEIPILSEVYPEIEGGKWMPIIIDQTRAYFYFGTKDRYKVGPVVGDVFHNERLLYAREGEPGRIEDSKGNIITLDVCHDFSIVDNKPTNIEERLTLRIINSDKREILFQELTEQFQHAGTLGFRIHFVGDINSDTVPEIFMTPINEKGGRNLWFISNHLKIELQSITYYGTGC